MRETLHHQSSPPITITITPKIRLRLNLRGVSVSAASGVCVGGGGVRDEVADGVTGIGVRVGVSMAVAVGGGVTSSSSFCPGRITEAASNPFQAMRFVSETSYSPDIQKSVSPLWTVW